MAYSCKILADSTTKLGYRLVTFEVVFPRLVLAEFNTHCMLARNSASSRAIPVSKQLARIMQDPFIPERFGRNQPGMQSHEFLSAGDHDEAMKTWLTGRDRAVQTAQELLDLGVHKQIANRVLEPYMWHTVITTATEWSNFFALRNHADAQPEIRTIAAMMQEQYEAHKSELLTAEEWHLPLLQPDEKELAKVDPEYWLKVVIGRCGRVSYLTHDGIRDPDKDVELFERLASSGHMSPLEHVGRPMTDDEFVTNEWSAKFHGFIQYRKLVPNEHDFSLVLAARQSRSKG